MSAVQTYQGEEVIKIQGLEVAKIDTGCIVLLKKCVCVDLCVDQSRKHGSAALSGRPGGHIPALDQSQRSRLCDRPPAMDICVFVPAAAVRYIRRVLLCARVAHFQDVLCAQTTRSARAGHPATGESSPS